VRQISGEDCEITGASRTDSGAHARGQVCHFDTTNPMPIEKMPWVLNRALPADLAVMQAEQVDDEFHSRFWCMNRVYRYSIWTADRDPFNGRWSAHYGRPLDLEKMQRAAQELVGRHDFLAFSQELLPHQTTVRELFKVTVTQKATDVQIEVVGTAFIRGMMRRIAGCLFEIGRDHRPVEDVKTLLTHDDKESLQWPVVLPAEGLTLMKVNYGRRPRERARLKKGFCESEGNEDE
jgi:tRNA pseudouridine38-40 synthase